MGLGYIGAITPLMPSTVFFLIALWAFKRSSAPLEAWLLSRPHVGPALRDWDENRSMTVQNKRVAIVMLWVTIAASMALMVFRHRSIYLIAILPVVAVGVTCFLVTVKTAEPTQD